MEHPVSTVNLLKSNVLFSRWIRRQPVLEPGLAAPAMKRFVAKKKISIVIMKEFWQLREKVFLFLLPFDPEAFKTCKKTTMFFLYRGCQAFFL